MKVQAQVLVEEHANAIIRKALGDTYRRLGQRWWRKYSTCNLGATMASAFVGYSDGNDMTYQIVKQTSDAFKDNVTECQYAQFYNAIGVTELGFSLTPAMHTSQ